MTTPTTDRELLELAAKAVGYTTTHKWNADRMHLDPPVIALVTHKDGELVSTGWDPLNDDGPAMRLAVKLRLIVCAHAGESWAQRLDITIKQPSGDDPYAATRRAIVRAAAEIGKAMP